MRAHLTVTWLQRTALLFIIAFFAGAAGSSLSAQTRQPADVELEDVLVPGRTVWLTDSSGRETQTRIVGMSGGIVTAADGSEIRNLDANGILRVRARESDSVLNGALIGAGVAVASGLTMCRMMEPWDVCLSNVGPMTKIGAVGAGIGIAVDALIRGRKTIYQADGPRLHAMPVFARETRGLQVSLAF
jgi:hypothetical protein